MRRYVLQVQELEDYGSFVFDNVKVPTLCEGLIVSRKEKPNSIYTYLVVESLFAISRPMYEFLRNLLEYFSYIIRKWRSFPSE